ncbi:MAG: YeeE/YedE family protein [Halodesulfurarchaeum sp.]
MTADLVVPLIVGVGLGICFQKGRFCFVNAFRDFFAYKDSRVTKGILVAILFTMGFWSIAYALGYYQAFWLPGWGLTGLVGGFIFGIGMTYAGGCASGTLYRAGQGYLHFWITLLFMGVGYVAFVLVFPTLQTAYFAPLTFGAGFTFFSVSPLPAPVLVLVVWAITIVGYAWLRGYDLTTGTESDSGSTASVQRGFTTIGTGLRSLANGTRAYLRGFFEIDNPIAASKRPWDPRTAALGISVFALIWFMNVSIVGITGPEARWAGYLLQQVGITAGQYAYWGSILFHGEGIRVTADMVMIGAVIVGAFLAAVWSGDFTLRMPKTRRLPNAVVGGFLMGTGSRLAPGCNVGNIYSGLAELSAHSFIATIGIVAGVYVMTHWLYRDIGCAI